MIDFKDLINSVIDLISPDVIVRYEFPDHLPVLFAERVKIYEVFQNLILNSIKHNDNQEVRVKIDCYDEGAFYKFSLTDNGRGIRPEHLTKIFGFFQTKISKSSNNLNDFNFFVNNFYQHCLHV